MSRVFASLVILGAVAAHPAHASEVAQYGVGVGLSPFGGSLIVSYHNSEKTSLYVALGGAPSMESPLKADVDGTEFTNTAGSTWVGAFWNHRPFEDANWFRFNTGIAVGTIESSVEDADGNVYEVEWRENPVGYIGVGVGSSAMKGLIYGFDLGWLQTAGPDITKVAGTGDDVSAAIGDTFGFGNVLPNLQLSVGYNF